MISSGLFGFIWFLFVCLVLFGFGFVIVHKRMKPPSFDFNPRTTEAQCASTSMSMAQHSCPSAARQKLQVSTERQASSAFYTLGISAALTLEESHETFPSSGITDYGYPGHSCKDGQRGSKVRS